MQKLWITLKSTQVQTVLGTSLSGGVSSGLGDSDMKVPPGFLAPQEQQLLKSKERGKRERGERKGVRGKIGKRERDYLTEQSWESNQLIKRIPIWPRTAPLSFPIHGGGEGREGKGGTGQKKKKREKERRKEASEQLSCSNLTNAKPSTG